MDKRKILIPILFLVAASVSFVIYGCGSGVVGGGGGGGTAPIITNLGPAWIDVITTPVSSDIVSLEVSWTTDVPSTTKLLYYFGTDESTTLYSTEETTLTLTHEVTVIVGSPEFCYQAASKNAAGRETISVLRSPVMYLTMSATLGSDADTYFDQTLPPNTFGGAPFFQVGDAMGGELRAALSFDISSVPTNEQVADSAMILYCNSEAPAVGMQVFVYHQFDPWLELASSWVLRDGVNGWTGPINFAPYAAPAGGGTITPGPVSVVIVGGGNVPGYWYFQGIYSIISTPGVNGIVLGYNPVVFGGGLNSKVFFSREGPVPPQLKLYLVKP